LKDVDSRVFTRMLWKDRQTDSSVTISLRNFVGEGIIRTNHIPSSHKDVSPPKSLKSYRFQIFLRSKYVPSLVKIH
jgi:hypothetical protein